LLGQEGFDKIGDLFSPIMSEEGKIFDFGNKEDSLKKWMDSFLA